jgi:hypothetical protein
MKFIVFRFSAIVFVCLLIEPTASMFARTRHGNQRRYRSCGKDDDNYAFNQGMEESLVPYVANGNCCCSVIFYFGL